MSEQLFSSNSKEKKPAWKTSDLLVILGGSLVLFFISLIILRLFLYTNDVFGTEEVEPSLFQSLGLAAIEAVALLGGVHIFGMRRLKLGWSEVGLKPISIRWWIAAGCISIIVIPLSGIIAVLVLLLLGLPFENPQLEFLIPEGFSLSGGIGMLLLGGIVVPFAEELFFRGVLYTWMRERWGVWIGIIASSLIFGIVHVEISVAIPAFVLGIILALVYEYSQSLWTSFLIHAVNNSVKIILLYTLLALDLPIGI